MKDENEKKGLFVRLAGKGKKNSCCCNIEVEEIPEENKDDQKEKEAKKDKGSSCCK